MAQALQPTSYEQQNLKVGVKTSLTTSQIPTQIGGVYKLLIDAEKEFMVRLNSRKELTYHASHLDVREPQPMTIYNLKGALALSYDGSQSASLELKRGSFGIGREREVSEM